VEQQVWGRKTPMTDVSEGAMNSVAEPTRVSDKLDRVNEPLFALGADNIGDRSNKLVDVVAQSVIPELLAKFDGSFSTVEPGTMHAGEDEIVRLASIVVGTRDLEAIDYVESLRHRGFSLDLLHLELLEPTARRLGELWDQDLLDFLDVTIGVGRLQRLVHYFARLDTIPPYDEMRRALIIPTPGEMHSLGITIVRKFLTAGGWHVGNEADMTSAQIEQLVSTEWYGVVGFSLAGDMHLDQLTDVITMVRKASRNPTIGIMVGGPAFSSDPHLVVKVGADGMASNGPAAVILAKKLLAASLAPNA